MRSELRFLRDYYWLLMINDVIGVGGNSFTDVRKSLFLPNKSN